MVLFSLSLERNIERADYCDMQTGLHGGYLRSACAEKEASCLQNLDYNSIEKTGPVDNIYHLTEYK